MLNPSLYIYGVPDGFNILGSDKKASEFFECHYNPSKENTKFCIQRVGTSIVYSYLKYNITSCKGREGAFFGMSLLFDGQSCCTDILKLYRFIDDVYNKVLIPDGKILKKTDGSSHIQAKFVISNFDKEKGYLNNNINSIIQNNIQKYFSDLFIPVDATFTSEQPKAGISIALDRASNEEIVRLLHKYNNISISPDWNGEGADETTSEAPKLEIPQHVLEELKKVSLSSSLFLNKCHNRVASASADEVIAIRKNVDARLSVINEYCALLNKFSSQGVDTYNEIKEQYENLRSFFESLLQRLDNQKYPPPPPPPVPWWKNPKILGIMGVAVIVVITLVSIIVIQKQKEKATQEEQVQIIADVRNYINAKEFQKARKIVWKIDEPLCVQLADSIIFCELNDITSKRGFQEFTSTWKNHKDEFSGEYPNIKQMALDTVANRRWRYIDNLVTKAEQATTKADKKSAKKIAEEAIKKGEGTELHNNVKAQKFRSRLDMIQILDESTGGSNVGKGKGTTVSAKQYQIQICSVLLKSDIDYKWNNNPDLKSYQNNTTLNGQYFYYCLASSSDGGHTWKRCGFSEADPLITVTNAELKMHSEFDGGYKIVKQTGTLTIKNGSDKFTITITNE